jgi:alpha-ribazole phosphatase
MKGETGGLKQGGPSSDRHSRVAPSRKLLLVRHALSLHAGERYIGRTETSLTPQGYAQAQWVCDRLRRKAPEVVYASPALRVRETITPLLEGNPSLRLMVDPDLQEIDFGRWEGLSFEEIAEQYPDRLSEWASERLTFSFPEGESLEAFWARVSQAGDRLAAGSEERVAVVTHGGVIRYLLCHYLGLPPERHRLFQIDVGSITTLRLSDGGAVLEGLNEHG